jgi:hypothetical protein
MSMPLPCPRVVLPAACEFANGAARVIPVPVPRMSARIRWSFVSGAAIVMPVPAAPAVPTSVTVAISWLAPTPTTRAWPATNPFVLVTLTFVSPAFAGAASVVDPPAGVPMALTVAVSKFAPLASLIWSGCPTTNPFVLTTLMLVSPAFAGATVVVCGPAAVPTLLIVGSSERSCPTGTRPCSCISSWSPTVKPVVLATLTLVSPTLTGAIVLVAAPAAEPIIVASRPLPDESMAVAPPASSNL